MKFENAFNKVFGFYTCIQMFCLILMSILVFFQLALREVLGIGIQWVFEISCFFQITMVWFGVPVLLYNDNHIKITALYDKFPCALKKAFDILSFVVVVACFIFLSIGYYQYIVNIGATKSPVLRIPNYVYYFSSFFGIFTSVVVLVYKVCKIGIQNKEKV